MAPLLKSGVVDETRHTRFEVIQLKQLAALVMVRYGKNY
jgi:hypothetical protein